MKQTTQFTAVLLVVTLVLGGLIYAGFESQRTAAVQREHAAADETAPVVAERIDYLVEERERQVRVAANDRSMRRFGSDAQRRALRQFMNDTEFATAAIVAANGTKVDIRGVDPGTRRALIGRDYGDRAYVREALDGEVYVTDPFRAESGDWIAVVSAPIRDADGEIVGVFGASIPLDGEAFFSTLERFETSHQSVFVSAADGYLYNGSADYDRAITARSTVEETGWTVRVERSREPLEEQIQSTVGTMLLREGFVVVLVTLVLAGFGAWVYVTNLRQARRLVEGFEAIEEGRYDHELSLDGSEDWHHIERGFEGLRTTLADRERQLRRERDRFAALFENVPDPAVVFALEDGDRVVRRVNSQFEAEFGHDAGAAVGTPLDELLTVANEEGPAGGDGASSPDGMDSGEIRCRTTTGVEDYLVRSAPLEGADRPEWCLVFANITEQKRRERDLARENERLNEFAGVVSHDLRSPLATAMGYLDLAREEVDSDHLEEVARAHERMDQLTEELLNLARVGETVGEPEPVSLAAVTDRAWRTVDTGTATLRVAGDGQFRADPDRLTELFENLFRNAVEHGSTGNRPPAGDSVEHGATEERAESRGSAPAGYGCEDATGADGTLTVEVGPLADGTGFYVADDGPGIPEEERDRVFDHGYSTGDDGTGLGLAIVQNIAEAHGWEVRATGSGGGGARFEVVGVEFE